MSPIKLRFSEQNTLNVKFVTTQRFFAKFGFSDGSYPTYPGPYTVTPTLEEQILETEKLLLIKDVIVEAIPVVEIPNTAGGITVKIG